MTVFANGLEVSAKAQGCKVIAAFPDPCFTPPQTPATPPGVPIPYPNFAVDSDLTSGTGTVKIGGKEVSQENSSHISKVSGDEAGAAPKKGVVTSKNTGKAYSQKWSMDVKAEGKGVVRFSDLATTNHACNPGQPALIHVGKPNHKLASNTDDCLVGEHRAVRGKSEGEKRCKGESHHIVPDYTMRVGGRRGGISSRMPGAPSLGDGLAVCLSEAQHKSLHSSANAGIASLAGSPAGTAPMSKIMVEALKPLLAMEPPLSDPCISIIMQEMKKRYKDVVNKNGRSTISRPKPGSDAFNEITPQNSI